MAAVAETRAMAPTQVAPAAATVAYQPQSNDLLPPGGGDDEVETARARRNRGLAYFLLGLAIVAIAVGAYALITNMNKDKGNTAGGGQTTTSQQPAQVEVPTVEGLAFQAASELLAARGLQVKPTYQASDTVGKSTIISQSPPSGTKVERNSAVAVVVSSGKAEPSTFPVPDVLGKPESEAKKLLQDSPGEFKVSSNTKEVDNEAPKGTVIKIEPGPDQQYPKGERFTLTVSTGQVEVTVPDVLTVSKADAEKQLKALGLTVGIVNDDTNPDAAEGTVTKQSIKAGTKVKEGTKVTLSIAVKPTPSNTPSPTDTPISPPITIGGGGGEGEN
jgi:serine/threonine-protein kinase